MERLVSLGLLAALASCVSNNEYLRLKGEKEALQTQHEDMVRYTKELQARTAALEAKASELQANAVEAASVRKLQAELRDALARIKGEQSNPAQLVEALEGVQVIETSEGVGFRVQGGVLFDSGQAEIRENGLETLRKLLPDLIAAGKPVRVDGHTDTDPIRSSSWRSNLHLSLERAGRVAEFLTANGFPGERLSVAGFGEHRPVQPGDTEEAKASNRRVEILIMK